MRKIFLLTMILMITSFGCASSPVKMQTLPNGIRLVAVSMPEAPVVSLQAWFKVGARNEKKEWGGASHFLEHLLFKRGKDPTVGTLAAKVESHGGEFNAATSHDFTYFYITLPPEHFAVGLEALRDALKEPSYSAKDFSSEKKVILAEMAHRRDDPWTSVYEKLFASLFPNHPYGRKVIGEENRVKRFTGLQIADYYRQQYRPDRLTFIMAGPLRVDQMLGDAAHAFSHFPASALHLEQTAITPRFPSHSEWKVFHEDISLEYFAVAWLGPPAESRDAIPMDLVAAILGGGRSSRLYKNLVERDRLAHHISASFLTYKDAGAFIITGTAPPQNHPKITQRVIEEIDRFKHNAPAVDELLRARTSIEAAYLRKHETPSGYAQSLGSAAVTSSMEDDLHYLEKIRSVTPAQIANLSQKYLTSFVGVAVVPK